MFGFLCFHSCQDNPGTCKQCLDFKRLVGTAAVMDDWNDSVDYCGQRIFDAMFPKDAEPPKMGLPEAPRTPR